MHNAQTQFDNGEWVNAIYMGIPMQIRKDGEGVDGRGLLSWMMNLVPFNGEFFIYPNVNSTL